MSKKFFSILFALLLQCLLPLAYADSINVNSTNVRADLLYSDANVGGSILPHFLSGPAFGGKLSLHSTGATDLSAALSSMQTRSQDGEGDLTGHTGFSIGIGQKVGIAYLSARQSYMHTAQGATDFFQDDMYETLLKAELANSAQKPYLFSGLIVPAYVPVEKMVGMGGFGFKTHTPVYNDAAWGGGLHTNTSFATSLFNINREQETIMRTRVALQLQSKSSPLEIDFGFNFFQDIRREEHQIWWDLALSYLF